MKCSPGKYDGVAPRTFEENIKYRKALIRWVTAEGEDDHVHHARRDHVWAMCQEDPFFYFDSFVFTYNPRLSNPSLPFILYDYQREAIVEMCKCLGEEDFLIEKSRDMGASWLCTGLFEWAWHFLPQKTSFLLVSRKEELVDKRGDMKSLMARLDFTLERTPRWLLPRYTRTNLNLLNMDNGSAINGESTTGDVARGDRRTAILLDEFAAVDSDYAVLRSTRDATLCRIFNATPNGARGAFYDMRCKEDLKKFRFHWSLHPDKAAGLYVDSAGKQRSPWYDRECARCVHPTEIAQELDIDYNASEAQFFDDNDLSELRRSTRAPTLEFNPIFDEETGILEGLDLMKGGEIRFWMPVTFEEAPSGDFAVGCDISQGTGATPSVAAIGNLQTGERVAEVVTSFRKPHSFAALVVALCKWLNNAFLIWEVNGPGAVFTDTVIQLGYKNIYHRRKLGQYHKNGKKSPSIGWASSRDTKLRLLGTYRQALIGRVLHNYCVESLDECRLYTFSANGVVEHNRVRSSSGDGSSSRENHGDRVIADALLAFCFEERNVGRNRTSVSTLAPPPHTLAYRRLVAQQAREVRSSW